MKTQHQYLAIIVTLLIYSIIVTYNYINKPVLLQYDEMTRTEKIEKLEETFTAFKALDGTKLHIAWHRLFNNYTYKLNGNPAYSKIDCSTAIFQFLKSHGANVIMENAEKMGKRLAQYSNRRKKSKEVMCGDLIIFYPVKGMGHIGMVECAKGNEIYYFDINLRDNGPGYRHKSFYNIKAIYPIGMEFWAGDALK